MDIKQIFEKELDELFNPAAYSDFKEVARGYAVNERMESKDILFIGLNPSFRLNDDAHKKSYWEPEQDSKDRYFRRFPEIADHCGSHIEWSHIDLLALRETSQKKLEGLIKQQPDFFNKNLSLTKRMIESTFPRVIVVTNTLAKKLLIRKPDADTVGMGYDLVFNPSSCTYFISNPESPLRGIPILFSGMLTGQRALDNGSFDRLKWHVNLVLTGRVQPDYLLTE